MRAPRGVGKAPFYTNAPRLAQSSGARTHPSKGPRFPMRLCRFDNDRLGLVRGERIIDVSAALHSVPVVYWPLPPGDLLIANLTRLRGPIQHMERDSDQRLVHECELRSPVANPTKILCAPLNYRDTGDTSIPDGLLERDGLELKAVTTLAGPAEGVQL